MVYKALTIAGSDSGGGAGIQADLKTFSALGVYGSSVITALTAQNTLGVSDVEGVTADFVSKQLEAVLNDIGADAVKTGMLYDADIIEILSIKLKEKRLLHLVVDPVMVATSGDRLLSFQGEKAMREKLVPLSSIITPNQDEAEVLCGFAIKSSLEIKKALQELHGMGAQNVLLTGFRQGTNIIDYFYDGKEFQEFAAPYIDTSNTHGTGCSFSAALTAFLARGLEPMSAVKKAKEYVYCGLRYSYPVGRGSGPINHMAIYSPGKLEDVEISGLRANIFKTCSNMHHKLSAPFLNVIIGGDISLGCDYACLTKSLVVAGAKLIQLREKDGDTRRLIELAHIIGQVCHENGALFVVNDRVDVALASGADGVHLGQDDMELTMARSILGPDKIIGISAGNLEQARQAEINGADYIGVGPAYNTTSKDCSVAPGGAELIKSIASQVNIPVVAIGGITVETTAELIQAGAAGVAVISAILNKPDPAKETAKFYQHLKVAR